MDSCVTFSGLIHSRSLETRRTLMDSFTTTSEDVPSSSRQSRVSLWYVLLTD